MLLVAIMLTLGRAIVFAQGTHHGCYVFKIALQWHLRINKQCTSTSVVLVGFEESCLSECTFANIICV